MRETDKPENYAQITNRSDNKLAKAIGAKVAGEETLQTTAMSAETSQVSEAIKLKDQAVSAKAEPGTH